METIDREITNY